MAVVDCKECISKGRRKKGHRIGETCPYAVTRIPLSRSSLRNVLNPARDLDAMVPSGAVIVLGRLDKIKDDYTMAASELPEGIPYLSGGRQYDTCEEADGLYVLNLVYRNHETGITEHLDKPMYFDNIKDAHDLIRKTTDGLPPEEYGFGPGAGIVETTTSMKFEVIGLGLPNSQKATYGLNEAIYDGPEVELGWKNCSGGWDPVNLTPDGVAKTRADNDGIAANEAQLAEQARVAAMPVKLTNDRRKELLNKAHVIAWEEQLDEDDNVSTVVDYVIDDIVGDHPEADKMRSDLYPIVSKILTERWNEDYGYGNS